MKKLSLLDFCGASRVIVDSYMQSNNYFIYEVVRIENSDIYTVVYKFNSKILKIVNCYFDKNNILYGIQFK